MTLLHPSRGGSAVAVWFLHDRPVRLASGGSRFRVVGDPKCADINGTRYWRVRALSESGEGATFDLRRSDDGWVLDGVDENATQGGAS